MYWRFFRLLLLRRNTLVESLNRRGPPDFSNDRFGRPHIAPIVSIVLVRKARRLIDPVLRINLVAESKFG